MTSDPVAPHHPHPPEAPTADDLRPWYLTWFCYVMIMIDGLGTLFIWCRLSPHPELRSELLLFVAITTGVIISLFGLWYMRAWGCVLYCLMALIGIVENAMYGTLLSTNTVVMLLTSLLVIAPFRRYRKP